MKKVEIQLPWRDYWRIVLFGDAHVGHGNADEALLRQVAESVAKDDHAFAIDLGDAVDAVNMSDPRFSVQSLPDWVTVADLADLAGAQVRRYVERIRPMAPKLLARLTGNHEAVLSKRYERDIYRDLCDALQVPEERRLGWGGFLVLKIRYTGTNRARGGSHRAWHVVFFLHHGATNGRLAGAKALALERLPMAYDADIYAIGHSHTKLVLTKRTIGPDGERTRYLINVGSFIRSGNSKQDYAFARLLYPQDLGPVEVWLYPNQRQVRIMM